MVAVSLPLRIRQAQPWITTGARLVLAAVLAYAAWAKMQSPALAVRAVAAYRLLPGTAAEIVGYGLPFLELALAALLLAGLATRLTAVATGVLMVVFVAGIASVWARGLSIDCGCFGGGGQVAAGQTRYLQEILRDIGFVALAAWIAAFPPGAWSLDRLLAFPSPKRAEVAPGVSSAD